MNILIKAAGYSLSCLLLIAVETSSAHIVSWQPYYGSGHHRYYYPGRHIYYAPTYRYPLDIEKIFTAAKERGCFVELNAQPSRLDLNDVYCLLAKQMGVKVAISSDAHSVRELDFMRYGINQARRGWLEKIDVINTYPLSKLKKLLAR